MIKVVWAADRKPGFSDEEFFGWWRNVHGFKEFCTTKVRRYVQHHSLAETRSGAYGVTPTRDGASVGWYDDFEQMRDSYETMNRTGWTETRFAPAMDVVIANEHTVLEGPTSLSMVKLIAIVRRNPDLSVEEFQQRWLEDHGARWSELPNLRRYVQNHSLIEAYTSDFRRSTHDGWSEAWFDDPDALKAALSSPEARKAEGQSGSLFERPFSIVVAREGPIVT